MQLKEKIYKLLIQGQKENRNISGEEIAQQCSVSRTAIWKSINSLRKDGHLIEAKPHQGYILIAGEEVFSKEALSLLVNDEMKGRLHLLEEVDSTNTLAKRLGEQGAANGTVILAKKQSAGKGRQGRSFFSPEGGIYLSCLFRPQLRLQDSLKMTLCAAVAVCRAVEQVCHKQLEIKWVNDLFYQGKKVCGILTEASANFESGYVDYVVIGIGVNLCLPTIPESLQDIAIGLYENTVPSVKTQLTATILNELNTLIQNPSNSSIMEEYRQYSMMIGKQIEVLSGGTTGLATVQKILDDGRLQVQYPDGKLACLSSGEVSIRLT